MQLGCKHVGPGRPCYIIAEIGQNHQGDPYHAVRLIQMATACGVDAVKLQARDCEEEFNDERLRQPYQHRNSFGKTYRDHRRHLDLDDQAFAHLKERHIYNDNPAELFTTVCAISRIDWLEKNNWCRFYKVASKDMGNDYLIDKLADTGKPLIISTGMASGMDEVYRAYSRAERKTKVVLMHCVSKYPLPILECNLVRIHMLRSEFGCPIGYSDHTAGVKAPAVAAIKHEADLLEVHVTKNRAQPGTDHAASLEEPGLRQLVEWVRTSEELG